MPVADFTMTRTLVGTIALGMVFTTNSKMETTCFFPLIRWSDFWFGWKYYFQADNLETCETQVTAPIQRELFAHESECIEIVPQEPIGISGTTECCSSSDVPENPPPTSEWLEDTLIDLYLSGYSNLEANAADDMTVFPETDVEFGSNGNKDSHELNEGELILDDHDAAIKSSENVSDEGVSLDEENWRAQYGQVIQSEEVSIPESSPVSLWDWEMITKPRKDGKGEVARLVGRLVRRSAKLHPSMPSGGGLLKTAPICEVHLDLDKSISCGAPVYDTYLPCQLMILPTQPKIGASLNYQSTHKFWPSLNPVETVNQ
ncbi:hypothetical protein PRUPE_5G169300 [Prunus persica]|uniref:Uncharacterized protein n=1 Tax=Prunus persica TaxID=3760 RepID=A0A251P9N6_PRUPE|nr:hypothetical protein PRUPE_5G169300 [Prunus persica]